MKEILFMLLKVNPTTKCLVSTRLAYFPILLHSRTSVNESLRVIQDTHIHRKGRVGEHGVNFAFAFLPDSDREPSSWKVPDVSRS